MYKVSLANKNTIITKWRTKYIFVDFEEDNNTKERFIVSVSIR